jgi:hypothetical protein
MMDVSWKYTAAFLAMAATVTATSIASYRSGFEQGSSVALCLVSTFQKGVQKQGLDMTSPACQQAKQGERNPLWATRKRNAHPMTAQQEK